LSLQRRNQFEFAKEVCPRLRGRAHLVRYADDAVLLFEYEEDARRVMTVLPQRFGKYGLTLHPDKTRLVPFKRPVRMTRQRDDDDRPDEPGTFSFLGFTIHWGKSPTTGKWVVKTRTAADRFRRTLKRISEWCKENRHAPLETQQQVLNQKLRGHYVDGLVNPLEKRREVDERWSPAPAHKGDGAGQDG
jgi:hypothetical protein